MNERFNLAASVLLSRRLKNLLRIDENAEIDMNYITCAEYQLFIDEKLISGEHRQPEHWTSDRFTPGEAKKPIVGVRASYAQEFCDWLTEQYSVLGFRYRLPTLTEVEEYPLTEAQVGCWCTDGEKKVIAGIEQTQWQSWKEHLNSYCRHDFDTVRSLANVFDSNQVLYVLLAKNIRENAKAINDNYLLKLSKALFAVTSPTILKHTEQIFNKIDFTYAFNINCVVDNSTLNNIVKPAIADVLDKEKNTSILSESMITEAQRALNESESKLLETEKKLQQIQEEVSQNNKIWETYLRLYDDAWDDIIHYTYIESGKHKLQKAESEVGILESNFDILEKDYLTKKKKFNTYKSTHNELFDKVKSNENELKKAQIKYNKLQFDINSICSKNLENSYYYLLFIATIFDWLLTQEDASYKKNEAQLKLTDQQSEGVNSDDYATKRDEILDLYTFLVLLDERCSGRIPAWEGIRIVRERS
ncbi:hypothetical protein [Scytonema sp. PCC 10023]|uniref:hypothetical protein n=1 Tax=Scytonema sp. PCC 10023 TaxID=1680591 RepID=UPI0039C65A0F